MATDIPVSFVKQFEREVHEAYQRKGSKLRPLVRSKSNVRGESTTFQKVGKGVAGTKTRHGVVPVMNVDHTNVECTLNDYYAGDWVDKLDELKIAHDERQVLENAGAYALGRKSDELLLSAMGGTSNSNTITLTSLATFRNDILESVEDLRNNDVPDEDVYGVVSERMWNWLLLLEQFSDADFIGASDLPFATGRRMKRWNGVVWMAHTGVPGVGTDTEKSYIFHKAAVGLASGAEVTTDITWHGDRAAHFISNSMSQGTCLIDEEGVVEMKLDATAALPTS